jgi:hypothetical protein
VTKAEAIRDLVFDARAGYGSKTSLRRVRAACKTLQLSEDEMRLIEALLDYRVSADSDVFPKYRGI